MDTKQKLDLLEQLDKKISNRENILLGSHNCLTGFMLTHPMPAWVKDLEGRMMFCNESYERHYGISPTVYNDNFDKHVWSKEEAAKFRENDLIVEKQRKQKRFKEKIFNEKKECYQELDVLKWPVAIGGYLLGIAGQVINERDIKIQSV